MKFLLLLGKYSNVLQSSLQVFLSSLLGLLCMVETGMRPKHEAGANLWMVGLAWMSVTMTGVPVGLNQWGCSWKGSEFQWDSAFWRDQSSQSSWGCATWQSATMRTGSIYVRRYLRSVSVTWSSAWDSNPESPDQVDLQISPQVSDYKQDCSKLRSVELSGRPHYCYGCATSSRTLQSTA